MLHRQTIIKYAIAAALVAAVIVYYIFDPASAGFFPKCPFRTVTGFLCPGCGSQRALHQLLHLNVSEAFDYNPALVLSIPLLILITVASLLKDKAPKLYAFTLSRGFSAAILSALLLWWIGRNL